MASTAPVPTCTWPPLGLWSRVAVLGVTVARGLAVAVWPVTSEQLPPLLCSCVCHSPLSAYVPTRMYFECQPEVTSSAEGPRVASLSDLACHHGHAAQRWPSRTALAPGAPPVLHRSGPVAVV